MQTDGNVLYKLSDGYQITKVSGEPCSLVFKNGKGTSLAVLESCQRKITAVYVCRKHKLTTVEKRILQRFINSFHYKLNYESAAALDLSVLQDEQGREEYLDSRQLQKRLQKRLNGFKLYVGKLQKHTLKIPSFTRGGIYNFCRAKVKKLVIEKNCDLLLDMRDNTSISKVRVKESFSGGINLSRSTVESIEFGNNCRCDLTINNSLRCFNLHIGDVYSGNMQIKNSCFHKIDIGYYCYANLRLADNWGRRYIGIGNSFRGTLNVDNVNVYELKIGNDCKGRINVSNRDIFSGNRRVLIAEDFAGQLDLHNSQSTEILEVGRHARGRFNLGGCPNLKVARFDKYFSGHADFSDSAVNFIGVKYGSSGELVLMNCQHLSLLKIPKDKNSTIIIEKKPLEVRSDSQSLCYRFTDEELPLEFCAPIYQKMIVKLKSMFLG